MNATVTKDDLEKIWRKWDKFEKPADSEDKAWKLVEKTCLKIRDMIFLLGHTDGQTAAQLGKRTGEITLPCFLLCYYIGLDLASGEMSTSDSSAYLVAATKPIDEFVLGLLEILVTNNITTLEEGRRRVLEIATLTGKAANDVCILGIYDYSRQHPDKTPIHKYSELPPLSNTPPISYTKLIQKKRIQNQAQPAWTFGRVLMLLAVIFLCLTGWPAIGVFIGRYRRPEDKLKGAFNGGLIGLATYMIIVPMLLAAGPLIGDVMSKINSGSAPASAPNPVIPTSTRYIARPVATSTKVIFVPNPTPTCLRWDQITTSMRGQRLCIQGTAVQVYPVVGSAATRINFSNLPNTFFVLSSVFVFNYTENGVTHDLAAGDCVRAIDAIYVFDDGRHQIPYMQITELYRCNP